MRNKSQVNKILTTPNNLIQFQVNNPYDGCHFEWSYAFITEDKTVHFVKHDTDHNWSCNLDIITEKSYKGSYGTWFNTESHCKRDLMSCLTKNEDCYVYNTDKPSIKEFIKTSHEMDIVGVAQTLYNSYEIHLYTKCPDCKQDVSIHDMVSTGYKGDGGIGIVFTNFVCGDCCSMGTCSQCGEYYGRDGLTYFEDKGEDLCEYCAPNCIVCDINDTTNEYGVCDDCQEEYAEEFEQFEQLVADHTALDKTPTFEGIDLKSVQPVFSPRLEI